MVKSISVFSFKVVHVIHRRIRLQKVRMSIRTADQPPPPDIFRPASSLWSSGVLPAHITIGRIEKEPTLRSSKIFHCMRLPIYRWPSFNQTAPQLIVNATRLLSTGVDQKRAQPKRQFMKRHGFVDRREVGAHGSGGLGGRYVRHLRSGSRGQCLFMRWHLDHVRCSPC